MKFLEVTILFLAFIIFFSGTAYFFLKMPTSSIELSDYQAESVAGLTANSTQFYPNMRFKDRKIRYSINEKCSNKRTLDAQRAFATLSEKTILSFSESPNPQIKILCENIAPEAEQTGHFVAGEGGPTDIVNTTKYAVILQGKVALYRPETCETPQVAIHEILHVLGFEHNNNTKSIMYYITSCDQELDQHLIDELERLYQEPSYGDMIIESIKSNKTSKSLDIEITFANIGLETINNSSLVIRTKEKIIKTIEIGEFPIGIKQRLTISNFAIPRNTKEIEFVIETNENELSKENNIARISSA